MCCGSCFTAVHDQEAARRVVPCVCVCVLIYHFKANSIFFLSCVSSSEDCTETVRNSLVKQRLKRRCSACLLYFPKSLHAVLCSSCWCGRSSTLGSGCSRDWAALPPWHQFNFNLISHLESPVLPLLSPAWGRRSPAVSPKAPGCSETPPRSRLLLLSACCMLHISPRASCTP